MIRLCRCLLRQAVRVSAGEIWILKQDMVIKMCEDAVIRTARKLSVSLCYGVAVIVWASVAVLWGLSGYAAEDAGAKSVVTGDNFTLTQKDIDAYRDFLQTKHLQLPPNELVRMVIQNELLSRAFDEEERAAKGASPADKKRKALQTRCCTQASTNKSFWTITRFRMWL